MNKLSFTSPAKESIVSGEAYRAFIAFMFAAAMIAWGSTLLGITRFLGRSPADVNAPLVSFPKGMELIGGILYGCVLIYFYWLYSENLAVRFLPTNMLLLILDFTALSFMAGAATAWRESPSFNKLAICTLILLTLRFGVASCCEVTGTNGEKPTFAECLLTHVTCVYVLCFLLLALLILGAVVFAGVKLFDVWSGLGAEADIFHNRLYICICVSMVCGIAVTTYHSLRPAIRVRPGPKPIAPTWEDFRPVLIPAYHVIPPHQMAAVAKGVFDGEHKFRHLLRSVDAQWVLPSGFHQSNVHTYRDVETQAFIMAHHARDPVEIKLRSMWVYLMHWFDDLFDGPYAPNLANMRLKEDFEIRSVLERLDDRFANVWSAAIMETQAHEQWNEALMEIGMRRLILSGPMLSPKCQKRHSALAESHKKLITKKLTGRYGVNDLMARTPDRYLAYTSKVVVEIWDSFSPISDFDLSMLMDMFYAPGLFYHDFIAECRHGEILSSRDDTFEKVDTQLKKVFRCIRRLPPVQLELATRPVSLFVHSFGPVLAENGLKDVYEQFLNDEPV